MNVKVKLHILEGHSEKQAWWPAAVHAGQFVVASLALYSYTDYVLQWKF